MRMNLNMTHSPLLPLSALILSSLLLLSACSQGSATDSASPSGGATNQAGGSDVTRAEPAEVSSIEPRVVLSHEGGLITLDAATGETVGTVEEPGFYRLNNAGDGQHVIVTAGNEFQVYNAGIQELPHGDHSHYYESEPGLTGANFDAEMAGHVVLNNGRTSLFADGTGQISTFTSADLAYGMPELDHTSTENSHHGVAIELSDGTMLTTQGTEEARDTIQHVKVSEDGSMEVLTETNACPGVHGEAAAAPSEGADPRDVVVFGCENGPVVFRDGQFHDVDVEPEYQRSGNLAGSEASPIVLGDWKVDLDAELERPTQVALINTHQDSVQTVDLGSSYWFRSLARGDDGEALVLTYDGELNVLDDETGEVIEEIEVIDAWEEKEDWQQPGPILKAAGGMAYVTDAENEELVVVDLETGDVAERYSLDVTAVEMAVVTGLPEAPAHDDASGSEDGHTDGHQHEGHDH